MKSRRQRLALLGAVFGLTASSSGRGGGVTGFCLTSPTSTFPLGRSSCAAAASTTSKLPSSSSSSLYNSLLAAASKATEPLEDHKNHGDHSVRSRLRRITGFSLTALRRTARAATGISLTALYASTLAATGAWMRQTMKVILSIFPAWMRYFVQPFLVLYYVPLFVLRNLSSPSNASNKQGVSKHEAFVQSWKQAVETADEKSSYWPLHVSTDGDFEKDLSELDVNEAVAASLEVAMEEDKKNNGVQPS